LDTARLDIPQKLSKIISSGMLANDTLLSLMTEKLKIREFWEWSVLQFW